MNVLVFNNLTYLFLLAEGKDDRRVCTDKSLKNNSIRQLLMPKCILLLHEILEFIFGKCIDNVFQCLQLIDHLHHRAGISEDFSCIFVLTLGWIEVGAENIDEGEVTQVGYTPLAHKCHDNFNTTFDIGAIIIITSEHMRREFDIKFSQNASSLTKQVI